MDRLLCCLAVVVLTGCGTTVQQQADGGAAPGAVLGQDGLGGELGAPSDGGLTVPGAPGGPAGVPGQPGAVGSFPDAAGPVTRGATTAGAGGGSVTGGGSPLPAGGQGPGITDTVIRVGIVSNEDPNEGNRALGLSGLDAHSAEQIYKSVIDDLNKRGGINGRKVELVVHRYGSESDNNSLQAAACETFARDKPVFAVLTSLGESAQACFEKSGIVTVSGGYASGYAKREYARFPHLLSTGAFDLDDQLTTVVNGLRAQGWLGGWNHLTGTASAQTPPHVGILAFDLPVYREVVQKRALPGLAAAGVKKVQVSYITPNVEAGTADAQATVQKFKAEGVSHVMFLDNSGGAMPLIFSINANSQAYFPRFGCDSGSCNYLVANQMPQSSLRGAVLVGWAPLVDVPESHDHVLPGRERCEKILTGRGMAPYSRNDLNVMANICSGVWFFEAAARSAGSTLTNGTLLRGAYAVGAEHTSPSTFDVKVAPGKHAGANAYRFAAWDTTCGSGSGSGCFIYTGPIRRFDT